MTVDRTRSASFVHQSSARRSRPRSGPVKPTASTAPVLMPGMSMTAIAHHAPASCQEIAGRHEPVANMEGQQPRPFRRAYLDRKFRIPPDVIDVHGYADPVPKAVTDIKGLAHVCSRKPGQRRTWDEGVRSQRARAPTERSRALPRALLRRGHGLPDRGHASRR